MPLTQSVLWLFSLIQEPVASARRCHWRDRRRFAAVESDAPTDGEGPEKSRLP
jgi:hypothetical protein